MNDSRVAILAISIVIPLTAFTLWFSDQEKTSSLAEEEQITVLTSFYPLYEFTNEVGKERINVSIIVPQGIEPHDWEPSIHDLQKMQEADMIVINGVDFEKWVNDFVVNNPNVLIVDTSEGIELIENSGIYYMYQNESKKDPHIWLDPSLAKKQVQNITNGLMKIDPEYTQSYQENSIAYNNKLDILDKKIRYELSSCNKNDFITFHDSFSYFAKEYELNQHTIVGIDPTAEPTAATLQQIIEEAQNLDLKIIYTDEFVNPRISEVIANEIGGKILVLSPIEIVENSNYIEKMEQNMLNLKEELCS